MFPLLYAEYVRRVERLTKFSCDVCVGSPYAQFFSHLCVTDETYQRTCLLKRFLHAVDVVAALAAAGFTVAGGMASLMYLVDLNVRVGQDLEGVFELLESWEGGHRKEEYDIDVIANGGWEDCMHTTLANAGMRYKRYYGSPCQVLFDAMRPERLNAGMHASHDEYTEHETDVNRYLYERDVVCFSDFTPHALKPDRVVLRELHVRSMVKCLFESMLPSRSSVRVSPFVSSKLRVCSVRFMNTVCAKAGCSRQFCNPTVYSHESLVNVIEVLGDVRSSILNFDLDLCQVRVTGAYSDRFTFGLPERAKTALLGGLLNFTPYALSTDAGTTSGGDLHSIMLETSRSPTVCMALRTWKRVVKYTRRGFAVVSDRAFKWHHLRRLLVHKARIESAFHPSSVCDLMEVN